MTMQNDQNPAQTREHVEAMIDAAQAAEAEAPRPAWLPAKFKTPEDLAKAYAALERKLGARPSAPSLDIEAMEREFAETETLSDEAYEALARVGVPRHVVDAYIEGQLEKGERIRRDLLDLAGGEQRFEAMRNWAEAALAPEDVEAFDGALSGTPQQARLAVQGLMQAYEQENGKPPQLVQSAASASGSGAFRSTAEVVEAMRDRRYKTDPAYREQVQARLARSNLFKR